MFKNNKKKPLLFYKYLISYLIIFLIPYMIVSIIFYHMSVNNLRDEIVQSNIGKLEQIKDITDSRMEELMNTATRISLDHRLSPYKLKQAYSSKEAMNELSTYSVNNSFIDEIYLYTYEEDQIYSSQGVSKLDTFIKKYNSDLLIGKSEFSIQMETISTATVLPFEKNDENKQNALVSYLFPIPPTDSKPYGTLMFLVKEKNLKKEINNVLGDYQGNIYIYNDANQLLVSSSKEDGISSTDVKSFIPGNVGIYEEKINGRDYSLVKVKSDHNWTFITAIPRTHFYSEMSSLKMFILSLLAIIALMGIVITVFMSIKQYKPINNLTQFIQKKQSHLSIKDKKRDELTHIRDSFAVIYEDSAQLQKKMNKQRPIVRDQFLLQLLKGNKRYRNEEITDLLNDFKLDFYMDYYFVVEVSFRGDFENELIQDKGVILNLLREIPDAHCVGYGVGLIEDNAIALIVNVSHDGSMGRNNQIAYVEKVLSCLQAYDHLLPVLGIGDIYFGTDKINRSYIEAKAATEYMLVYNYDESTFFADIKEKESEKPFWYPIESQVKLIQSLKQGDEVVAVETVHDIICSMKEMNISIPLLKTMCFDIINTVLKNILEQGLITSIENLDHLVEFESLEDLNKKLNALIIRACNEVEERKESHNIRLRDSILAYIDNHYKLHELSLEHTAEKFQLSASYLSRFMKEQAGKTFSQYVWELRHEEFKRQLRETNYSIKKIVMDIGYVDVASFSRKFKKDEGLTPGQYRKHHNYKQNAHND